MDFANANPSGSGSGSGGYDGGMFEQGTVQAVLVRQGEMIARRVVASLRVRDWGLFGGGEGG